MIQMLIPQNSRNESHAVVVWPPKPPPSAIGQPGTIVLKNVFTASPPIHAWMPNQPHATSARISAGTFDPNAPYAARANTGNGMPYFVPGCELSRIGTSTIVLPSRIVTSACAQLIPEAMRLDASI